MSKTAAGKKELTQEKTIALMETLKSRFENNMNRHEGIKWEKVEAKLIGSTEKL